MIKITEARKSQLSTRWISICSATIILCFWLLIIPVAMSDTAEAQIAMCDHDDNCLDTGDERVLVDVTCPSNQCSWTGMPECCTFTCCKKIKYYCRARMFNYRYEYKCDRQQNTCKCCF